MADKHVCDSHVQNRSHMIYSMHVILLTKRTDHHNSIRYYDDSMSGIVWKHDKSTVPTYNCGDSPFSSLGEGIM